MIIVFAHTESPRLTYIFSRVFTDILGVDFYFTTDKEKFLASPAPSINYSTEMLNKGVWIVPHSLLYDTGVSEQNTEDISSWKGMPTFFSNQQGDIPFDLFAASFFLITRYEEYYAKAFDVHGRYQYTDSIVHRMDCIESPIVDQWAYALKEELLARYPECKFFPRTYHFIPTIDVDHPYLYRNKGFIINIICLLKDLMKGNFLTFRERFFTISFFKADRYFNFKFLLLLYQVQGVKGLFFVHRGPYGAFDRRYLYPSRRYDKMLREIACGYPVCIHPSYAAAFDKMQLMKEKRELERLIDSRVVRSRNHFLRIRLPESYRLLLEAGITHDYSLLYSSRIGFRAGTSIPFPFYDVEKEQETGLIIHPSAVMDVTLSRDYGFDASQAYEKIREIAAKVKAVNGDFITLFHNSTLSETKEWKNWRDMYAEMIKQL